MTAMIAMILVQGQAVLVLKGLDPIDLVAGKEVLGKQELSATYLRHEYRFSSKAHVDEFRRNPVKYAVQDGGACGKMGALTGKGSPDRFAVVRGKIYLFASDRCRSVMLASQDSYFAELRKPPRASLNERNQAATTYASMVKAHGGAAVSSSKFIGWVYETAYKDDGKNKIWLTHFALAGRDKFAQWESWDLGRAFFVVDGHRDAEGYPNDFYGIHPRERRALTALFARHPAGILRGLAGTPVAPLKDGLTLVRDDIVLDVHLDAKTRRITQVAFRDRHAGPVSDVIIEYSDYEEVNGIWLPMKSRHQINGGEWSAPKVVARYTVDDATPQPLLDAFGRR
ncbi:MAG: hypothetical protein HONBIEJF_01246 [Fimbriimonadaceae bacterium]|nr:hypothetical protein [Fimbriimonadaceae bacterium]